MISHILLGCAVVTFYAGLRLIFPTARCPWCMGKRVTRQGKRASKCRLCDGHGRLVWPGATAAHRFLWSVLGRRLMDRRKEVIHARIAGRER